MTPDRIGQQLGNYRLIRLLGGGGFAQVYLGEHVHLHTQAAVKILHTQIAASEIDSFLIEAQTIAHLEHPHIVRVLDFDVAEGIPFLVMSYAPNGTLRQRHSKGTQLPLPTIVSYVTQLADALLYAHDEKLIHRDVKPENMLVGRRNEVLLSDFGIALIAQSSRYQSTQDVIGTVAYMAPEQIQGKPRPASDQYSLAIAVYEWLCGYRPFHGSFTELCTQHMYATPSPLREKVPTLSLEIEQVVLTALAKDPRQRFASMQAFAAALEQASQTVPTKVTAEAPDHPFELLLSSSYVPSEQHSPSASLTPSAQVPTLPSPQNFTFIHPSTVNIAQPDRPELLTPTPESNRTPLPILPTPQPATPAPSIHPPQRRGFSSYKAALLVILAILFVGSAGLIYNTVSTFNAQLRAKAYDTFVTNNGIMSGFDAAHTGFNPFEQILNPSNVSTLTSAWSYPAVGVIGTSPAVANGVLYFGSLDKSLYALDARSGSNLWKFPTQSAVVSTPVVANGVVYVGSSDHSLYALDAHTGKKLWSFATGDFIDSTPAVADGVVYIGSGDHSLYAVDARTGKKLWSFATGDFIDSTPAVADGVVYIGSGDHSLYAVDARTGKKLWSFATGGVIYSTPAVADGVVYVGSFSYDHALYAVDARTGTKLWSFTTGGVIYSSPAVVNGVVYVGSHDHSLYAVDARTGTKLWSFTTGGVVNSSPAVANGVVYVWSRWDHSFVCRGCAYRHETMELYYRKPSYSSRQ